jgi:diguanylate cyclase (GGDEF)-like protein/PAS domain S-box-containing protein
MDLGTAHPILDTAHNAFISMDERGRITYWNPRAAEIFGYSREEAVGRELADTIIPPEYRDAHWEGLRRFLAEGVGPVLGNRLTLTALRRDGAEFPIEITISALREADGWSFHAFVQDISERVAVERERDELLARVEALARTDALTGLPNRRAWDEELRREVARASRGDHTLTVALLDLDHFKAYNDTYGHQAGDTLLRDLGAAWRTMLRVTDLVARYGGEEFAVLLPDCSPGDGRKLLRRMCAAMPDEQTFSAGVASWDGKETVESLVQRADGALYEAKDAGRNRFIEATPAP